MKKQTRRTSELLLANSSFLTGAGSVRNIAGNHFSANRGKSGFEADFQAIASDWGMVGKDIEDALEQKDHEEQGKFKAGVKGS